MSVSEKCSDDTSSPPTTVPRTVERREPLLDATNIKRQKKSEQDTPHPTTDPVSILTYEIIRSSVSVQVLSTHTVHDLVDVICKETRDEQVWDHMWNVSSHLDEKVYESGDIECTSQFRANKTRLGSIEGGRVVGADLILIYDYGDTSLIPLKLTGIQDMNSSVEESSFPRRAPVHSNFVPYIPSAVDAANMDELFPDLSKFLFAEPECMVGDYNTIQLFQPGSKKVQAFVSYMYDGCRHMIHIPQKFDSVESMLWNMNQSVKLDKPASTYGDFPDNNWFGISIFPYDDGLTQKFQKYKDAEYPGLDCTVARKCPSEIKAAIAGKFLKTFPKCAAAAGYSQKNNKPSKRTERAWILYRNGVVTVCRGASKNIKSGAPSPGVWDGCDKHEPENRITIIVGKANVLVKSLQELFCTAEALL